jgi:hypothetical protein
MEPQILAHSETGTTTKFEAGNTAYIVKRIPQELASTAALERLTSIKNAHLAQTLHVEMLPDAIIEVAQSYVVGDTLKSYLKEHGPLAAGEAYHVIFDLLDGAHALHQAGIVHRDITPNNIIMGPAGAVLIDMGIARVKTSDAPQDTHALGTWGYAAPEQFGFAATDDRSDFYSLGQVFLTLLTGRSPQDLDQATLTLLRTHLPATMAVIGCMTAFEPSKRHQTYQELYGALVNAARADAPELAAEVAATVPAAPTLAHTPTPFEASIAAHAPALANVISASQPSTPEASPAAAPTASQTAALPAEKRPEAAVATPTAAVTGAPGAACAPQEPRATANRPSLGAFLGSGNAEHRPENFRHVCAGSWVLLCLGAFFMFLGIGAGLKPSEHNQALFFLFSLVCSLMFFGVPSYALASYVNGSNVFTGTPFTGKVLIKWLIRDALYGLAAALVIVSFM